MSAYKHHIHGFENQVLELTLEPGQRIQAEKGAMTYMDESVRMKTRIGEKTSPFQAIKRRMAGETFLINEFTNESNRPACLALSPQHPSNILMLELQDNRPDIICRPDAFLAGDTAINVSIARGATGPLLFGRGNLLMQRLHGQGQAFITGNGIIIPKTLRDGQTIVSDLDSLIAFDDTVDYQARMMKGARNLLFGGESMFLITTTGPGRIWMQSLSRFEVAAAHIKALIKHEAKALEKRRK